MRSDEAMVKLDFKNAFNSVHRDRIMEQAFKVTPEIAPYVYSSYCAPTMLRFGNSIVLSSEGTQQGDPLGALLFCLAVQPLLDSLKSDLVFGNLDDLTLGEIM